MTAQQFEIAALAAQIVQRTWDVLDHRPDLLRLRQRLIEHAERRHRAPQVVEGLALRPLDEALAP